MAYSSRLQKNRSIHPRLNGIHEILRCNNYPNKRVLSERFGCSERTIERDIEQMRDDYRAPIEYCSKRRGYFYTCEYNGLALSELTEREQIALMLAGEVLQSDHLKESAQIVHRLIQKANSQYSEKFSILSSKLKEHVTCMTPDSEGISEMQIICLIEALFEYKVLTFEYRKPGESYSLRKVHPYHLTNSEGDWYLKGHCQDRGDLRTFKLQRIRNLSISDDPFLHDPDYDTELLVRGSLGGFTGNKLHHVKLKLDSYATEFLKEKKIHSTQLLSVQNDTTSFLELELNNLMDIQRWVLSWGEHIEVLAPAEFVKSIRETLNSTINLYSDLP